jgi:putative transposase
MNVRFIQGGLVRLFGRRYLVAGYVDGYWHFTPDDPTDKSAHPILARFDHIEDLRPEGSPR